MENNHDVTKCMDSKNFDQVPIQAISSRTCKLLNDGLCSTKQLLSPHNYQRDYRGLCDLMEIKVPQNVNCENLMYKLLFSNKWTDKSKSDLTVATFLGYLERIDRYDVYDDCIKFIEEDCGQYLNDGSSGNNERRLVPDKSQVITMDDAEGCLKGEGLAQYDAILLYDDSDSDMADQIFYRLVPKFNICNKNKLFVVNNQFEYNSFIELIKRCKRVIVLCSPAFMENELLKFLMDFAQANLITHKRNSLIIPIICTTVQLDFSNYGFIEHCYKLKPFQHNTDMDKFWQNLDLSLLNSIEEGELPFETGLPNHLLDIEPISNVRTPPKERSEDVQSCSSVSTSASEEREKKYRFYRSVKKKSLSLVDKVYKFKKKEEGLPVT